MLWRALFVLMIAGCVPEGRTTIVPDPNSPMGGEDPTDDPGDDQGPSDSTDGEDDTPPVGSDDDPNALHFRADVLPILEAHCTECHDPGRALNFTSLPLGPAGAGPTVELMLAAATTVMPPAPREKLSSAEIETIRTWKMQGLLP